MKSALLFFSAITGVVLLSSCGNNSGKNKQIPYVAAVDEDFPPDTISSDLNEGFVTEVCVPFLEVGGVRTIQVKINECSEFPMIFDTGCSGMTLSVAEANVMAKHGCICADDIEGFGQSIIADGSIVTNMIINLREIRIGDLVCRNVKASVSDNEAAPILLGNGVLDKVSSFSIDNVNKMVKFQLK